MDGVLVDFDHKAEAIFPQFKEMEDYFHRGIGDKKDYNKQYTALVFKIMRTKNFWLDLPWMHDGRQLYEYVKTHFHPDQVAVLTAPMNQDTRCEPEKREWVSRNLHTIPQSQVFVDLSKENYVGKIPGKLQILVDDRERNIVKWREAGGIGIHHSSASTSIYHLES